MNIRPLTDAAALQRLLVQVPLQPFLQSWAWGDFQQSYGRRVWRLGAYDGEALVGAMTVVEHQLMLSKRYLYVPRGPVVLNAAALQVLATAVVELGRERQAMYVKIDPAQYAFPFDWRQLSSFEPGTTLQEPNTLVLDLRPTTEQLLAGMHPKTRYNIRLAEKHGVQIRWSTSTTDHAQYLALQKETAERQGVHFFPDRYFELMFSTLVAAKMGELAIAELDGQALAINLILWHEQTAIFNHGGSTQARKEVMAPYLLQWAAIQEAKRRGCQDYDFRGIAPEQAPHHKLAGVTRFKLGFGGRRVVYPDAENAILDRPWWMMYRLAKRMRGRS